jgi:CRISPR/Cas system-associated endoribonuclease Cas2
MLIHQLPPKPTNLRVRTWRKLQKLGAVAVKNSVYVLPFNEKTYEDFQWLKQEIETAGGEAAVFRAVSVEIRSCQDRLGVKSHSDVTSKAKESNVEQNSERRPFGRRLTWENRD